MEELDKKWIINPELGPNERSKKCQTDEKIPTTLGLENMHDAFYLIAAGESLKLVKSFAIREL